MNPLLARLDPKVAEVLRDVALDPDSILLRHKGPIRASTLHHLREPLGPMAPFLSAAERHLLRLYRDEVGTLFHHLARAQLSQLPIGRTNYFDHGAQEQNNSKRDLWIPESRAQADLARIRSTLIGQDSELEHALDRGHSEGAGSTSIDRILQLVSIAQSLRPHPFGSQFSSCLLVLNGQSEAAVQLIKSIARECGGALERQITQINLGFAYVTRGEFHKATQAYGASADMNAPLVPKLDYLVCSVLSNQKQAIVTALGLLKDHAHSVAQGRAVIGSSLSQVERLIRIQSLRPQINATLRGLDSMTRISVEDWIDA